MYMDSIEPELSRRDTALEEVALVAGRPRLEAEEDVPDSAAGAWCGGDTTIALAEEVPLSEETRMGDCPTSERPVGEPTRTCWPTPAYTPATTLWSGGPVTREALDAASGGLVASTGG